MNLYTSLMIKNLKENKKRTLVTIVGIVLATSLIVGIGNIFSSLRQMEINQTIQRTGNIHTTFNEVKSENKEYITKANNIEKSAISKIKGHAKTGKYDFIEIREYDENSFDMLSLSLMRGKFPKNENEIVLTENAFNSLNREYDIDDYIELEVGEYIEEERFYGEVEDNGQEVEERVEPKIENTNKEWFKVVGIVNRPDYEYLNSNHVYGYTYLDVNSLDKSDEISVSVRMNDISNVYDEALSIAKNAKVKFDEEYGEYEYKMNEHLLRYYGHSKYSNVNTATKGAVVLTGGLVIMCTIATIYNSFSISILERKKQYGILNSIGATKSQIKKLIIIEGLILSLISIPLGIFGGTLGIDILFKVIQSLFGDSLIGQVNLSLSVDIQVLLYSVLIVLITILISIYMPAKLASRISPLEAIKNTHDYKVKKIKSSKIINKIFGIEGDLAYKGIRRNKKRFLITLFSLVVSVVIFVGFSGLTNVMLKSVNMYFGQSPVDFILNVDGISTDKSKEIENILNKNEHIQGIKILNEIKSELGIYNEYMDLYADEKNVNKEFLDGVFYDEDREKYGVSGYIKTPGDRAIEDMSKNLIDGEFIKEEAIKENGVILVRKSDVSSAGNRKEVDIVNYEVGDVIECNIRTANGQENIVKYKVLGISEDKLAGESVYEYNGVSIITYDEVVESSLDAEVLPTEIWIKSKDMNKAFELIKDISSKYKVEYTDNRQIANEMKQTISVVNIFVYGFVILITLVSTMNIINTMSNSISLRKREFAIIKSIGITDGGFTKMIYLESLLYGMYSLIIGVPLGMAFSYLINKVVRGVFEFDLILPYTETIICAIFIFVITFISAYIPMKKINKENIIENIRSESI